MPFSVRALARRVRLLVNRQTEEAVAVKVIDTSQVIECAENVKKEVCVHKVGRSVGMKHTRYLYWSDSTSL